MRLQVVQPIGVGLPDPDRSVRDAVAVAVQHLAIDDDFLVASLLHDLCPSRQFRRVFPIERAEQAGLGRGLGRGLVVQRIDEGRDAENVGQQDELLPDRGARVADGGKELDPLQPFGRGEVHLAGKRMQVLHRGFHDLTQPRIRCPGHLFEHGVGYGEFVQILHRSISCLEGWRQYRQSLQCLRPRHRKARGAGALRRPRLR